MPPKNRAKKETADDPAAWREHQRRLRNRLSQKAVRERKAARIQQLEQQLATVTKGGDSARVSELLNTNSRLRHALLDTRKKLASLSVTATQLGERIKVALDDFDEAAQDSDGAATNMDMFDTQSYNMWKDTAPPCTQSPPTSSTESIPRGPEPDHFTNPDLDLMNPGGANDVEATYINPIPTAADRMLVSMDSMFDHNKLNEAIHGFFPSPQMGPKLNVYTGSLLSQHLDHIHGLLRLGGALDGHSSKPQIVEGMMAAFLEYGWPSMKYWFEATQSSPLGSSVMWWQTYHSHEAANQVPPGNTPTPIQLSRLKYPCILDWVPHPGLRDNLILNYHSYDVDQVVCDMTNSFVVEIEESVPVACVSDPALVIPTISKGYSLNLMELVERTLIFGPVHSQSKGDITVMKLLRDAPATEYATIDHPIHRFKVDPRFFDKYPALYDANAESKYRPKNPPYIQKSQLAATLSPDSMKGYMDLALNSKTSLVAV